jgi:hypothetical protein
VGLLRHESALRDHEIAYKGREIAYKGREIAYKGCEIAYKGREIAYKGREIAYKGRVPRRLFFAAPQRIAITLSPNYYQKNHRFTTRKNQEEHGPDVM